MQQLFYSLPLCCGSWISSQNNILKHNGRNQIRGRWVTSRGEMSPYTVVAAIASAKNSALSPALMAGIVMTSFELKASSVNYIFMESSSSTLATNGSIDGGEVKEGDRSLARSLSLYFKIKIRWTLAKFELPWGRGRWREEKFGNKDLGREWNSRSAWSKPSKSRWIKWAG